MPEAFAGEEEEGGSESGAGRDGPVGGAVRLFSQARSAMSDHAAARRPDRRRFMLQLAAVTPLAASSL